MLYSIESKFNAFEYVKLQKHFNQEIINLKMIENFSNHLVSNLIKNNGPEFIEKTDIKDEGKIIYHKFNISFHLFTNDEMKKVADFLKQKLTESDYKQFLNLIDYEKNN